MTRPAFPTDYTPAEWVVCWNFAENRLIVGRSADVLEHNANCFLDDTPPLAIIREGYTREMADNYVRAQRELLAKRHIQRARAADADARRVRMERVK